MEMRIVVATDGTDKASGALHVAEALSHRHGAAVEVISVREPFGRYGIVYPETVGFAQRQLEEASRNALRWRVEEQLVAAGPEVAAWPLTIELGAPAPTILRFARAKGATLIVLGLGRHNVADRCFGSETALRVMRLAHVPVLAVPAGTRCLPQVAVAAVDFSDFSHDAAETALQIIQPDGALHLAHVLWKPSGETAWVHGQDWPALQRQRLRGQLEDLAGRLEGADGVKVETHFLEGDTARETLHLAETLSAGLIAAGSHGAGFFGRLLMGSVSTRLVRSATRMVLIAPPRTVPAELQAGLEEANEEVRTKRIHAAPTTSAPPAVAGS